MYYLKMISNSVAVAFSTNCLEMRDRMLESSELRSTIPGLTIQSIDKEDHSWPELIYLDDKNKFVDLDTSSERFSVSIPYEELYFYDIIYLTLLIFSRELNKIERFIVHCAAVEKQGECILIAGDPGAGKTTTALHLCLKHGYKLVSNDRTVIGIKNNKPFVFSGTLETTIRPQAIDFLFPQFRKELLEKKDKTTNKIIISDSFESFNIETAESGSFRNVFFINTYPTSEEGNLWKYSPVDSTLALVRIITECIRGGRNAIISNQQLIPSFDSVELMRIRERFFQEMATKCTCWGGRGTIREVCDKIILQL